MPLHYVRGAEAAVMISLTANMERTDLALLPLYRADEWQGCCEKMVEIPSTPHNTNAGLVIEVLDCSQH